MDPDIEVSTEPEKKDETPVSFVDDGSDTIVTIGDEKKEASGRQDDERWRQAEETQQRLARGFDELRSRLNGGSGGAAPQAPQTDRWQSQEDAITAEERALGIQWEAHKAARTLTGQLVDDFDKKARALQQRRTDIATERALERAMPTMLAAAQAQNYRAQYGDVQSHPQANMYARGQYDMLRAQGHPDSPATVELAMNAARSAFGLGGRRQSPTDRDRDQLSGYSNTRRTNMEPKNNVVKMGKSEKIMAMAMYGQAFNGDEKKVYSQWAKGPGIRAQKAMQKGRQQSR
jgi:hypothetical protein